MENIALAKKILEIIVEIPTFSLSLYSKASKAQVKNCRCRRKKERQRLRMQVTAWSRKTGHVWVATRAA
jgi:hypothetical protein